MARSAGRLYRGDRMNSNPAQPAIVTLTMNPAIDESASATRVIPDHKLRCDFNALHPGGGGVNVSRTIRRLGGDSLAIFPSGGPAGALLEQVLSSEGVSQKPIPIRGWTRRNLNVREEATGCQFRFVMSGPTLAEDEWSACLSAIGDVPASPEFIVASGSLPPGVPQDFLARVARLSRETGSRLLIDSSGESLRLALEAGVYLVKPSLREFETFAGEADMTDARIVEHARRWIDSGWCQIVVISLGSEGAVWVDRGSFEHIQAPTVHVRSTVGAGDSMLAGIVLALARGRDISDAVRFGVATASASVMNDGTSLARPSDVDRLLRELAPLAKPA